MASKNNNAKKLPSKKYLDSIFTVDGSKLIHKNYRDRVKAGPNLEGKSAGKVQYDGRVQIVIEKEWFLRSRIIWKMVTGKDPKYIIDHDNGDCSDDNFYNLKDRTLTNNQRNSNRRLNSNNTTGICGLERITQNGYKYWRAKYVGKILYTGNNKEIALERLEKARKNDPNYIN